MDSTSWTKELSALIGRLDDGDRRALRPLMVKAIDLWADDQDRFDDALDEIAAIARRGDDLGLECLLSLVHQLGLARPGIRRLILDPDDLDEIAQTVLARVEQKIDLFDGRSRFRTWLFSVARNEARMHVRRASRRPDHVETDVVARAAEPGPRLSSLVATRTTIEEAIGHLPDHYRVTLRLQLFDQLSLDQIAARLDLPVGTVKSRLAKARTLLGEELLET